MTRSTTTGGVEWTTDPASTTTGRTDRVSISWSVQNDVSTDYRALFATLPGAVRAFDVTYLDGRTSRIPKDSLGALSGADLEGAAVVQPVGDDVTSTLVDVAAGASKAGVFEDVPSTSDVMYAVTPVDERVRTLGLTTCSVRVLSAVDVLLEAEDVTIRTTCVD
ncbi:hypothetical protein [Halorubellus salinus]|uniref:hypothetical protein n=1 Tax=Halorubellus salinus TaxID=755309 RepID=UPI001D0652B9|nr:hypothetical protein [Halorubellus salinus]